jgi:hypothetical protein
MCVPVRPLLVHSSSPQLALHICSCVCPSIRGQRTYDMIPTTNRGLYTSFEAPAMQDLSSCSQQPIPGLTGNRGKSMSAPNSRRANKLSGAPPTPPDPYHGQSLHRSMDREGMSAAHAFAPLVAPRMPGVRRQPIWLVGSTCVCLWCVRGVCRAHVLTPSEQAFCSSVRGTVMQPAVSRRLARAGLVLQHGGRQHWRPRRARRLPLGPERLAAHRRCAPVPSLLTCFDSGAQTA